MDNIDNYLQPYCQEIFTELVEHKPYCKPCLRAKDILSDFNEILGLMGIMVHLTASSLASMLKKCSYYGNGLLIHTFGNGCVEFYNLRRKENKDSNETIAYNVMTSLVRNVMPVQPLVTKTRIITSTNSINRVNGMYNNNSNVEQTCRSILENYLKVPFKKVRLECLKNPKTGRNLELDCYNASLNLALEYNGEHHYKYMKEYHKTENDFEEQKYRDKLKKELCDKNYIKLIVVPFTFVAYEDIKVFIISELDKLGYKGQK